MCLKSKIVEESCVLLPITLSQIPEGIFSHFLFIQQMFNKYALNMTALQVGTDLLCPHRSSILVEGGEQNNQQTLEPPWF